MYTFSQGRIRALTCLFHVYFFTRSNTSIDEAVKNRKLFKDVEMQIKNYEQVKEYLKEEELFSQKYEENTFDVGVTLEKHQKHYVKDTRRDIVDKFNEWLSPKQGSRERVFWLSAGPGMGKSVTMAQLCFEFKTKLLGAHFCDHRNDRSRSSKNIMLSLAYQLCKRLPWYKEAVDNFGKCDENGEDRLWNKYFEDPFRNVSERKGEEPQEKMFLMIDALDEADLHNKNSSIVKILRQKLDDTKLPDWIGFAVSSRPEVHIIGKLCV